ncbi:hypothetical protein LTR53_011173 [Teratosphaeriaceae sp. CCFEE 6253]|nr:hypothetical protein LTR53_011173 [Teratosphaeriaceae sp. CCFEE 6253]
MTRLTSSPWHARQTTGGPTVPRRQDVTKPPRFSSKIIDPLYGSPSSSHAIFDNARPQIKMEGEEFLDTLDDTLALERWIFV